MNEREITYTANNLIVQRLLTRHFSASGRYATREIAGATINIEPSRHRTGLPEDALCRRYLFTNTSEGWSIAVRAAWRGDRLYEPAAVHCQIDHLWDDDGRYDNDETAIAAAVNRWLRSLPL